jgi:hypothetical protein
MLLALVLLPIFVDSILGMQFKYPEILWGLLLLLIPIFIHLFQLRRYQKTPFTNVKLLKKVISTSRKSSTLKKWLILLARMGVVGFLVLAFAGPYTAQENALTPKSYVFYLDNSFSMHSKAENGTLLQQAIQTFAQNIPEDETFTLFTNTETFRNVQVADIKNELLNTPVTSKQLSFKDMMLKGQNLFEDNKNREHHLVLISDFQQQLNMDPTAMASTNDLKKHFVKLKAENTMNTSIDSVYLENTALGRGELVVQLSATESELNLPVSLYNGNELVAKTAAQFQNQKATVRFTLPEQENIKGRVVIADNGLEYDNQFYFSLETSNDIRVMCINVAENNFLTRIFTEAEFLVTNTSLAQLNYSDIASQNLIILNELEKIPNALTLALQAFLNDGGSVAVIPGTEIDANTYNALLSTMANTQLDTLKNLEVSIAEVNTAHPLYKNVFEGNVTNFQYPKVSHYFTVESQLPMVLGLQNGAPFLLGNEGRYVFTASLGSGNSNFKNSPLIVPTFYNMGKQSLKLPPLYSTLGNSLTIEVPITLSQDEILKLTKGQESFIPQQEVLPKKVRLLLNGLPETDGTYTIENKNQSLQNISFNYDRKESELRYTDVFTFPDAQLHTGLEDFFEEVQKNNAINEFWKWFVILALVFVLLETALHKLIK